MAEKTRESQVRFEEMIFNDVWDKALESKKQENLARFHRGKIRIKRNAMKKKLDQMQVFGDR